MLEVLGSIWWLIVALGVLVTFHEFGHYWVARRCGVRVLKFSVGFGRSLWSHHGKDGTEYAVSAIPLGGYVKMLDEREGDVSPDELEQAFNRKPLGQRFAIVAAGPIFNFVFAVFAFWLMFMIGVPESRPIVGQVEGIAAESGFQVEDEIVAVDGERTRSWQHALLALLTPALDRDTIDVTVESPDGLQRDLTLDLSALGPDFREEETLESIGLAPWRLDRAPEIGNVTPASAAADAGLRAGDRITAIQGEATPQWNWIPFLLEKHAPNGESIEISYERNGVTRTVTLAPRPVPDGAFGERYVIGVESAPLSQAQEAQLDRAYLLLRYGPVEGFSQALSETWRLTSATLGIIGRMITGAASVRNVSGPIGIAQIANDSASAGLTQFLWFLALISLSLAILNLLPIPMLDGGHLLYYLIELLTGRPVSEQAQITGQYIGLVALFGLISLGVVNDILRLVG